MPHTEAHHLLDPLRSLLLSPRRLVARLNLKPDFVVLELGPGPGFFSPDVARAVPNGMLVLVDVQQEMLDLARKGLAAKGITNVEFRLGDAACLPAADDFFDVVFLSAVLGEVPNRSACLQEIHRVLRPGGLLSLTEFSLGDPHFIPELEMRTAVEAASFHFVTRHGRLFHYTLGFRK